MVLTSVILEQLRRGAEEDIVVVQPLVSIVCVPSLGLGQRLGLQDTKLKQLGRSLNSKPLGFFLFEVLI